MIDNDDMEAAIGRIALTADGQLLHAFLTRALMETCAQPTVPGALPLFEGRRSFAAELKRPMDRALEEAGSVGQQRPVVISSARGSVVAGRASAGARRNVGE